MGDKKGIESGGKGELQAHEVQNREQSAEVVSLRAVQIRERLKDVLKTKDRDQMFMVLQTGTLLNRAETLLKAGKVKLAQDYIETADSMGELSDNFFRGITILRTGDVMGGLDQIAESLSQNLQPALINELKEALERLGVEVMHADIVMDQSMSQEHVIAHLLLKMKQAKNADDKEKLLGPLLLALTKYIEAKFA